MCVLLSSQTAGVRNFVRKLVCLTVLSSATAFTAAPHCHGPWKTGGGDGPARRLLGFCSGSRAHLSALMPSVGLDSQPGARRSVSLPTTRGRTSDRAGAWLMTASNVGQEAVSLEGAELKSLRSHMPASERALQQFLECESVFSRSFRVQEGKDAATAAVDGLVVCRQMARHCRVLDGGRARVEAVQELCAEILTRQVADVEPSQLVVALNSLPMSSHVAIQHMYVAAARRLLEIDASTMRTKDVILVLNALSRAHRELGGAGPWSDEMGKTLAQHFCRGLVQQSEAGSENGGAGLNVIDAASLIHAMGKLFPAALLWKQGAGKGGQNDGERTSLSLHLDVAARVGGVQIGQDVEDVVEACVVYGMEALLRLQAPAIG